MLFEHAKTVYLSIDEEACLERLNLRDLRQCHDLGLFLISRQLQSKCIRMLDRCSFLLMDHNSAQIRQLGCSDASGPLIRRLRSYSSGALGGMEARESPHFK